MAKTSGGVRSNGKERTKSMKDLTAQRYRIQTQAYRQYGSSEKQRVIRDRVKSIYERYFTNFSRAYNGMIPSDAKAKRSTYMGLSRR